MKNLLFFIVGTLFLASCGGGGITHEQVIGDWKLTNLEESPESMYVKEMGKEPYVMTDCDKQTVWHFKADDAEALGDGTAVKVLEAEKGADCQYYDFSAKWTVMDGVVFINSTSIGGMGGRSLAGQFKVIEIAETKMVLEISNTKYTFEKM